MNKEIPETSYQENIPDSVWIAEEQLRMASERTFLSWVRTGLTSVGIGIGIAKFLVFRSAINKNAGKGAGIFLMLWGIGIFVFALMNYRKNFKKLKIFSVEKHPLFPMAVITLVLVLITLALLAIILE